MVHTDIGRKILLLLMALVFIAIAMRALFSPEKMAEGLGYSLHAPNGYSEFYAIYVGVWLATAGLAIFAAVQLHQPVIGDILAILVLAQPIGRVIAIPAHGLPTDTLFAIFILEVIGGVALLIVRPTV